MGLSKVNTQSFDPLLPEKENRLDSTKFEEEITVSIVLTSCVPPTSILNPYINNYEFLKVAEAWL